MSDQDNFTSSKPSTSSEPVPSTPKSISNLTRIQRNVAEKQRRDKLNGYISELATIVPMVSMSSKRLDKTSILRLSAAHLRLSKSPLSGTKKLKKSFKWCPSFLTGDQVRDILESVDGFLIVTSSSGKILFTSSSVERYLGHQNIDLIGHSLFMFIHPDDVDSVKEEMEGLLSASLKSGDSDPAPRCSFRCRMKEKGQPRSEVATYQYVHFTGNMTVFDEEDGNSKNPKSTAIVTHLFKAFVRIVDANPYCQLSLEEATADEYITRHTLDGTIIFADHRLATITGHLPQEVTGLSAYKYILPDDVSIALFAHHLMFSNDKGTGMVVYRLRTRDEKYVYLKSVGSLQFDRATSQVDHFVCVNQHLSDEEGEAQLKYFTDRFIPHIQDSSALTLMESVKAFQVVGLNPPHNIGGVKDILSLNKFSLFNNSNLGTQNHAENTNAVKNKVSNCILENLSIHPQSQNYASSSSESSLSPVITSQISSPLKPLPDKSSKTVVSVSSVSSDFQTKTKKDVLSINRKRRASDSIPAKSSFPNVKTVDSIVTVPESTERTLLSTKPVIMQNGDIITSLDIPSSNGFHVSSVPLQNLSVKEEIFCATNEIKQVAFRNENKHLPYVNQASDYDADYQSLLKHASCQTIDNSGFEQMHISEVSAAKNVNDIHLQISSESDICSALIQSPFNKKYGEKVCTETSMSNTANTYDMPSENVLDVKSNIMLSTSSVLYSNDLQKKVSKAAVVNSNKLKSSSNTFSIRKTRLSDSDQLSSNVNDVVIETNLWPVETNSESSASNTAGEDTFVSATACSGDDPNLYFLPAEEMKDYLGDTDDITSVLNTALPFDDSSLPSVDGWNQYLRPEDMLNHPNVNTVVHIDGEQHLINGINGYEEKPSEMW